MEPLPWAQSGEGSMRKWLAMQVVISVVKAQDDGTVWKVWDYRDVNCLDNSIGTCWLTEKGTESREVLQQGGLSGTGITEFMGDNI